MQIRRVTADDLDTIEALVDVENAASLVDSPWSHPHTTVGYAAMVRHGYDGEAPEVYAAAGDSGLVGAVEVWTSEYDNTHLAWLWFVVHPDARRRGLGSELFDFARKRAAELGRTSVGTDGWDIAPTRGFAERHGLPCKGQAINRRQYLGRVDHAVLDSLHAEATAAAASYDLLRIEGRTPAELMEAVAKMTEAINDAPTDDLDVEDEVYSKERIEGLETATLARDRRMYRVVARHRDTGELAGHTVVQVEAGRPGIGHQGDTSVVRAHRGHRLGLLVKTEMLRWLADVEPQLASIDTWNAESNDHMIAVNEALGYTVLGRGLEFQIDI